MALSRQTNGTPGWPQTLLSAAIAKARLAIFLFLFLILLLAWIVGFVIFHVAGALIHLLLVAALVLLIVHLVRGARARI
jgi:Family of unknown function (DUF5670)